METAKADRVTRRRRWLLVLSVVLLCILSFEIYRAIYPGEAFYRAEFERISGTAVPDSARFVLKEASFPDHFGDYTSCALFVVDEAD